MSSLISKAQKIKSNVVNVELEFRLKIPPPIYFKTNVKRTITYYRCSVYPSLTFRSSKDYHIQSKEVVEKRRYKNGIIVLSIEQTYTPSDFRLSLIEINKRTIQRMVLKLKPLVEIVKCENEYTLEVEFESMEELNEVIKNYMYPYYPPLKPMEVSAITLAKKLAYKDQWVITPKADGIHVIVIEGVSSRILLFDNGTTRTIKNKANRKMIEPLNVFEGELMPDNRILYFDCLVYNKKDVTKSNYIERLKYCKDKETKEIMWYNPDMELRTDYGYKIDGFIIINIYSRKQVYKSKFRTTVDLRYKNGYLLLENEELSDRIPKDPIDLEDDKIYEFYTDLTLVKERNDKITANYKFPYEDNPLQKIISGEGIPTLRWIHNKIKYDLLKMLKGSVLLDIGSGLGGDINKWINLNFKNVYAIDPEINFRTHNRNIIEIKNEVKDLPAHVEFDLVSIFFVPWDDSFVDYILRSKQAVIIIMDKPHTYKGFAFECLFNNNIISLKIKNSATATNIEEKLIDKDKVFKKLEKNGYIVKEIIYDYPKILNKEEKILKHMYLYYYVTILQGNSSN